MGVDRQGANKKQMKQRRCHFLAWTAAAFADFSGKVVAVKDGDTLEVMKEDVAVQVRLYGIDCPEKGQALGQREKQFASDLAFGKSEAKAFSK